MVTSRARAAFDRTAEEVTTASSVAMLGPTLLSAAVAAGSITTTAVDRYTGACASVSAAAAATATSVTARIQRARAARNRDHRAGAPGALRASRVVSFASCAVWSSSYHLRDHCAGRQAERDCGSLALCPFLVRLVLSVDM